MDHLRIFRRFYLEYQFKPDLLDLVSCCPQLCLSEVIPFLCVVNPESTDTFIHLSSASACIDVHVPLVFPPTQGRAFLLRIF
jgi:hypothetical protein